MNGKNVDEVDWKYLENLASSMEENGDYKVYADEAKATIRKSLVFLEEHNDLEGIIRLRSLFDFLASGEPIAQNLILSNLNLRAIEAAERFGDHRSAGQFLHTEGHNLHRQGNHEEAIAAFERSAEHYRIEGDDFRTIESYYMTALCHRALHHRAIAIEIIERVLADTGNIPWRANPLSVLAWLQQDDGDLVKADTTIREAVDLFVEFKGADDIQVAQCLADLGEVVGFQGRFSEAESIFQDALEILSRQPIPQPRQVARTLLKSAEVKIRANKYEVATGLLREAYLTIVEAGFYDLMWRIQLAWAQVNLKQKDYPEMLRHLRLALKHRHAVHLSDWALVRQYLERQRMGTGLPR